MSKGFWQTERQRELLPAGMKITARIKRHIQTWENRCYSNGIPDEAPETLAKQGRVPSYKAIAMAILKNDHTLKSLGMGVGESETSQALMSIKKEAQSKQRKLF